MRPGVEELAVLVEYLHAMVVAIVDEDAAARRIHCHAVHVVHVSGTRLVGRITLDAPVHQELSILVELRDTSAGVTVGHEERPIRQPVHERRPIEVGRISTFLLRRADRLHQLLAVVGELVDHLHVVVDNPHVLLGMVRADVHGMRAPQDLVPLRPRLDDVAVGVGDDDAVLPLGVDAKLSIRRALDPEHVVSAFPRRQPLACVLIGSAGARERRLRRVSPHPRHRKADAGAHLWQQRRPWGVHLRELTAEQHEDAIRTLGKHALSRTVGPLLISGQRADVLRPAFDDLIRAGEILVPMAPGTAAKPPVEGAA